MTDVLFVVGSGRCGTALLGQRLFPTFPGVKSHHEFKCEQVQELGIKRYQGVIGGKAVSEQIKRLYVSDIAYSLPDLWVDCSNKLSWLIGPLADEFPNAKWVHLVRSGPETARSFYHKLADECYTDRGVRRLAAWLDNPRESIIPPQEKEWWWPIPDPALRFGSTRFNFLHCWDRWRRLCWYWAEVNTVIQTSLQQCIPMDQQRVFRLEELVEDDLMLKDLIDFAGLKWGWHIPDIARHKHNIGHQMDYPGFTELQLVEFDNLAGEVQRQYYG